MPTRSKRTPGVHPLIALNAALVLVLGVVSLAPPAGAQPGRERPRGEYTMVGGAIRGGNTNAVFIVDGINQELVAVRWNPSRRRIEGLGFRDLNNDSSQPRQAR